MAVFEYRGLSVGNGKSVHGFRDADNQKSLRAALKREGILLTSANEDHKGGKQGNSGGRINLGAIFNRVGVGDVAMMTRQLATLVTAGIPLVEAVTALIDQVEKQELQRILTQVRDRVNEGQSFAKALEPHSKVFPNLYVNMVAAGEASGTLEQVLDRLSDFMENQAKLRSKVSAALAYPILMVILGTGLISVMMIAVVPKVTSIFASLDKALPWYTSVLIFISDVVSANYTAGFALTVAMFGTVRKAMSLGPAASAKGGSRDSNLLWVVLSAFVGIVMLLAFFAVSSILSYVVGMIFGALAGFAFARFIAFLATEPGRLWRDTMILKAPLIGNLARMLAVARFSRTLSTLLSSGVPLLKAMEIVKNVLDNAKLEKVIETATGSIREGESIAAPLKRSGDFPPIVTHMIAVGEKSGQLENMLENVAKAYDIQVDTRVQALTSLMEPLIIVFLGGAVGFIAFSILMPLIQMSDF
ncbi:type II secretion system inner membrane protein GspF [soil metagenome]